MTGHRALIVEDYAASAEDLGEILRSLGFEPSEVVDNKQSGMRLLKANQFCLVLLDLEIKGEPSSIRGHTEHGNSFLRELRALFPVRGADGAHLPVLVISAHANDRAFAVDIMKAGADDVIVKPFETADVSRRVRDALQRSGRPAHARCASHPDTNVSGGFVLGIPGNREKRQTRVSIGQRTTTLPNSDLKVLLHLVIAKLEGRPVHKADLGGTDDRGFKGISNLRRSLKGALPDGADIIGNDYNGSYFLIDDVEIGVCDVKKLGEIGDATITALATRVGSIQKV